MDVMPGRSQLPPAAGPTGSNGSSSVVRRARKIRWLTASPVEWQNHKSSMADFYGWLHRHCRAARRRIGPISGHAIERSNNEW